MTNFRLFDTFHTFACELSLRVLNPRTFYYDTIFSKISWGKKIDIYYDSFTTLTIETNMELRISATNPTIHSLEEWRAIYSREEYRNRQARAIRCALHFQLVYNNSTNVVTYVEDNAKQITTISTADEGYENLTPLHIAVMRVRIVVVEALLKHLKIPHINAKDARGWTPLHHAALVSQEIYKMLLKNGADPSIKNAMEGTPEDIKRLRGRFKKTRSMEYVTFQEGAERKPLSALEPESLKQRLNLECYNDSISYPPSSWEYLWKQTPDSSEYVPQKIAKESYNIWKQNPPPKFFIDRSPGLQSEKDKQLGLFGDEAVIKAGQCLGEFGGQIHPAEMLDSFVACFSSSDSYSICFEQQDKKLALQPKPEGSHLQYANCGFPNSFLIDIVSDGAMRHLVIAGTDIHLGQEILWSYGVNAVNLVFGIQKLIGLDEMHAHFANGIETLKGQADNLENECKKLNGKTVDVRLDFISRSLLQEIRFMFPLDNPAAILDLHFRNIVPTSQWQQCWDTSQAIKKWRNRFTMKSWYVYGVMERISDFDTQFKIAKTSLKQSVSHWILDSIGRLSLMQILKGMEWMSLKFQDAPDFAWDEYQADLEKRLASYDFQQDENSPLSPKKIACDYLHYLLRTVNSEELLLLQLEDALKSLKDIPGQEEARHINNLAISLLAERIRQNGSSFNVELFRFLRSM